VSSVYVTDLCSTTVAAGVVNLVQLMTIIVLSHCPPLCTTL